MNYKRKAKNTISRNISETDLQAFKEYDNTVASRNKLLYKLGVDISMSVEVIECQHRNLQNKVVDGKLFMCFERLDKEWVKSGHASTEAFLAYGGDETMAREVTLMNGAFV